MLGTRALPALALVLACAASAAGQVVPLDLQGVRPGPVTVSESDDAVAVTWPDESGRVWRATFSLDPGRPLIRSITVGEDVVVYDARPFYESEVGVRSGGWDSRDGEFLVAGAGLPGSQAPALSRMVRPFHLDQSCAVGHYSRNGPVVAPSIHLCATVRSRGPRESGC